MSTEELNDAIAEHEEWLIYCLANARRAKEVGSTDSLARNIADAGDHAAIVTSLKAIRAERSA
jgi:hypothetical protein